MILVTIEIITITNILKTTTTAILTQFLKLFYWLSLLVAHTKKNEKHAGKLNFRSTEDKEWLHSNSPKHFIVVNLRLIL